MEIQYHLGFCLSLCHANCFFYMEYLYYKRYKSGDIEYILISDMDKCFCPDCRTPADARLSRVSFYGCICVFSHRDWCWRRRKDEKMKKDYYLRAYWVFSYPHSTVYRKCALWVS